VANDFPILEVLAGDRIALTRLSVSVAGTSPRQAYPGLAPIAVPDIVALLSEEFERTDDAMRFVAEIGSEQPFFEQTPRKI
jgi:hypothetical protein